MKGLKRRRKSTGSTNDSHLKKPMIQLAMADQGALKGDTSDAIDTAFHTGGERTPDTESQLLGVGGHSKTIKRPASLSTGGESNDWRDLLATALANVGQEKLLQCIMEHAGTTTFDGFKLAPNPETDNWTLPLRLDLERREVLFNSRAIYVPQQPTQGRIASSVNKQLQGHGDKVSEAMLVERLGYALQETIDPTSEDYHFVRLAHTIAHHVIADVQNRTNVGEMALQQFVYPAVSILFRTFAASWQEYKTDQEANCEYLVISHETEGRLRPTCKPDAAIIVPGVNLTIATMELKAKGASLAEDEFKCVVVTSMALLALARVGADKSTVAIPFVTGEGNSAKLFATRFSDDGKDIVIEMIHEAYIKDDSADATRNKHKFLMSLIILLSDVVRLARTYKEELKNNPGRLPNLKSIPNAHSQNSASKDSLAASKGSSTQSPDPSNRASDKNPSGTTKKLPMHPYERESAAGRVAKRCGQIGQIHVPWSRTGLDNVDRFQQESPFFFCGVLVGSNERCSAVTVFCKVWKEGDARTKRKHVLEEIDFFRQAHIGGVPTPALLDNLTCMDINHFDYEKTLSGMYHALVTEYKASNAVSRDDVLPFALSLVQAVQKLHSIGILHCDIKPGNILWDSNDKVVRLVDFGHAQETRTAISYDATDRYQAPEVTNGEPHSELSDAYGVGKTLEEVLAKVETNLLGGKESSTGSPSRALGEPLPEVVSLLTLESVSDRMTLEEAENQLKAQHERNKDFSG